MYLSGPCLTPETIEEPEHPEGDIWAFLMIHGEVATWADSLTELLTQIVEGYIFLEDTPEGHREALGLRYEQALSVATSTQTSFLIEGANRGEFDPDVMVGSPVGDEQLQALMIERTVAFDPSGTALDGFRDENGAPVWSHPVPLVLISTDYAPFTDLVAPTGNIVFIDPSSEATYLDSLHRVGRIVLLVNDAV